MSCGYVAGMGGPAWVGRHGWAGMGGPAWTAGMGERKPVVECKSALARDALVACLSPNRRVEIEVSASQP